MKKQQDETLNSLLAEGGESEWIEFKENNSDPEKLGQYISSLSNGALLADRPFGYLVFGVKDETLEIVGTNFRPLKEKVGAEPLEAWLVKMLEPRVSFKIYQTTCQGKEIIIFKIPAANERPVRFKSLAYIRIRSITTTLGTNPQLERAIWKKVESYSFETAFAKEGLGQDEVFELLFPEHYFRLLGMPMPSSRDKVLELLVQDELVSISEGGFAITNMGAILFGKDLKLFGALSRKGVRAIIYEGKSRIKTKKEQQGRFGYAVKFDGLLEWISDQLPMNEVISGALRTDKKMYPILAIRELLANAMIHQDFNERGNGILVEIFDDRIEITNPGMPLVDPMRLLDFPPKSRNDKLASLMRRMGICEERGSGIDKVVFQCEAFQLPAPAFSVKGNNFIVTLFAPKEFREMDKGDRVRSCYLHACLKYVMNESMTNQTLRERFGIEERNYPMASRVIKETIEEHLIKLKDPKSNSKKFSSYLPFWA